MKFKSTMMAAALASAMIASSGAPAQAITSFFTLADHVVKREAAKAFANKQHIAWCKSQAPGFRPKWNNWRKPNGNVRYCKSPYFTPIWMTPYKG